MMIGLLIALGFVLSAFFSGAETALVSMNWIRLEHWLEKGRSGARVLEKFASDPERLLGTTLVGTNLAVVMTSSLVSWVLMSWLGETPQREGWSPGAIALLSTAIVTPTLLMLGEVIPKIVGRRHSDSIVLRIVHPLRFFYYLLSPVIWLATGLARGVLLLFGVHVVEWRKRLTKDQLQRLLTSEGEMAGAVDKEETKLITRVFEFGEKSIGEVMVPRTDVVGLSEDATVGDAVEIVRRYGFSRLPVISGDREHIESMVHSRDLLGIPREQSIEALKRPVPHVPETKTCDDLFRELQARRQHMAVVIDEHGSLSGIVTLEDLLEELVGEIEDEYDIHETLIRAIDRNLFMVDGRAEIDAVEEILGVELPEGDYNTVAGLLLKMLGRIPESGEEIVVSGLDLRVVSASPTRIGKVRIRKR